MPASASVILSLLCFLEGPTANGLADAAQGLCATEGVCADNTECGFGCECITQGFRGLRCVLRSDSRLAADQHKKLDDLSKISATSPALEGPTANGLADAAEGTCAKQTTCGGDNECGTGCECITRVLFGYCEPKSDSRSKFTTDVYKKGASADSEVVAAEWPWQTWCHQRALQKYNYTGCVVDGRSDLPPLTAGSTFNVSYAQHVLAAGGLVAKKLGISHSMIYLQEVTNDPKVPGITMLIEFAAIKFAKSAILPEVGDDGTLSWHSEAAVSWYPLSAKGDWLAEATITPVGSVSGSVLSKWFEWVPTFGKSHPNYQLWSVWNGGEVLSAKKLLNESICHTFSEEGLIELSHLGADFHQQDPLCRNFFAFQSASEPEKVGREPFDASTQERVNRFYKGLDGILQMPSISKFAGFVKSLGSFVESERGGPYVFLHDVGDYYAAKLTSPFVVAQHNQRMLLPWQNLTTYVPHECRSPVDTGSLADESLELDGPLSSGTTLLV